MIVYAATKGEFLRDTFSDDIHEVVLKRFREKGRAVGPAELTAWRESLVYMAKVLNVGDIPDDAGIGISADGASELQILGELVAVL